MNSDTPLSIHDIEQVYLRHDCTIDNGLESSHDAHLAQIEMALSDAQHLLTPENLAAFHDGIQRLLSDKRNDALTIKWIATIPYVFNGIASNDDDAQKSDNKSDNVTELIFSTTMELGRWVSTERQVQFIDSLHKVAPQISSVEEWRIYINLVDQLALKAPRNLKTFLDNAPQCLLALPLTGFRYWAFFGANAHAHQYDALDAYFSLASTESQTVFQKQRKGTLFNNVQRHLHFFLRAVWGVDFFMRAKRLNVFNSDGVTQLPHEKAQPTSFKPQLATIEDGVILLPDAIEARDLECSSIHTNSSSQPITDDATNKRLYRAMAAHCAAHIKYSSPRLSETFSPLERICIGLFEDARVEAMAISMFPGLKRLWMCFHHDLHSKQRPITDNHQFDDNPLLLLKKIAYSLLTTNEASTMESRLNETIETDSTRHLVTASQEGFSKIVNHTSRDNNSLEVEHLGCWLALSLEKAFGISLTSSLSESDVLLPYRDDNKVLWCDNTAELVRWQVQQHQQVRRSVSVTEMVNEIDCELADEDAQEIWTLHSEFFRDGDPENISMNEQQANEKNTLSPPFLYPEWDYGLQAHRPDWVTLTERRVPLGASADIDNILAKRQMLVRKIKTLVESLQPKGLTRLRKQYDGDGLDLDAAIDAMKELRRGALPEMNIDQRLKRQERDLAVLVLLDLSQSTLDTIPNDVESRTVLDVAQEATVMLASALDGIGDAFAIHGFSSNGRQDVQYQRYKDFEEEYDDKAKSRLAGIQGGLSTRMGTALRHAKTFLAKQPQRKKLLLLVGDGQPADIDVRDPLYLQADTRRAVDELCSQGVIPYCLTIDPDADNYVSQIFGQGHYTVVDKVAQLPDVLPSLFASLTKRAG
ncbi:nitric oxide reductase activation protein NorD [Enterovibrio calviensis]|uniref:nitric oxide reductase activation protein NorD n=1 Tax=Enterovibrio calviensis TaxID=91359 RepID=UPI0009DE9A10|nr:VWA domain-containing protein [Enterovibrio calviensis]